MKITYTIIQLLIWGALIALANSDIQLIPGIMIILNAINFYIISKK